jgi:hypothetical protein
MLTAEGRACAILLQVRNRWGTLTPDQQAECEAVLERLSAAMRREQPASTLRPLPLVGRLSA